MNTIITDVNDWGRVMNICLCIICIAFLLADAKGFLSFSRSNMMFRVVALVFTVSTLVGSIETLLHDSPSPGYRTWMYTLALLFSIIAVVFDVVDKRRFNKKEQEIKERNKWHSTA